MRISTGDRLPDAEFLRIGAAGIEKVALASLTRGRKVALFAVPGAYTGICSTAHMPSFIRVIDALKARGVDEVACIAVNDPFVMKAWGEATGATAAGITMLSDADGSYARALGQSFEGVGGWIEGRSRRYAMLVEDGVVRLFHPELGKGVCETSSGEALLAAM